MTNSRDGIGLGELGHENTVWKVLMVVLEGVVDGVLEVPERY